MTSSTDSLARPSSGSWRHGWRAERERRQREALPCGAAVVTCSAPLDRGGLGRHLREILDAYERGGERAHHICGAVAPASGRRPRGMDVALALAAAPARVSAPWRAWRAAVGFDVRAAGLLPQAEHLVAFAGQALEQLGAARLGGAASLSLMSATAHVRALERQHALAHARHPIEPSWAGRLRERTLREYAATDRVLVSSRYALESFLSEGFSRERLALFPLTPAARFEPAPAAVACSTFDVVYVGGLSVVKGTPLLIEAFGRLPHADLRLRMVGGPETRPMRRYLQRACSRDPRVRVAPGDPLPTLRAARLYVHPSYSDGFGYAPAEALACGLPAIVSEDTGMKELIARSAAGLVVPTGDPDALVEAIDCAYRGELSLLPHAPAEVDGNR